MAFNYLLDLVNHIKLIIVIWHTDGTISCFIHIRASYTTIIYLYYFNQSQNTSYGGFKYLSLTNAS